VIESMTRFGWVMCTIVVRPILIIHILDVDNFGLKNWHRNIHGPYKKSTKEWHNFMIKIRGKTWKDAQPLENGPFTNVRTFDKLQRTLFDVKCVACCSCKLINKYKIETMYVDYIYMEIYVLVYINIFSPFYYLCITIM